MVARPLPAQRRRRRVAAKDRRVFLEALAAGWAVRHAAERTGIRFSRWYDLRKTDEKFAQEWADAYEQGTQALEDEARRRAVDGYDEETYDGEGVLVRRVHRYSDALMQTMLKGRRPEMYRDTGPARVELNARLEIETDYTPPTLADVLRFARELELPDVIDGEASEVTPELTRGKA